MVIKQRKIHFFVWILLALIIPVLISLSVLFKDEALTKSVALKSDTVKIPAGKTVETSHLTLYISTKNNVKTLNVVVKKAHKSASVALFGGTTRNEKKVFLGLVNGKGVYEFELQQVPDFVVLYDEIKQETIKKIEL